MGFEKPISGQQSQPRDSGSYVYGSQTPDNGKEDKKRNADLYAIPWTDEQKTRKRLQDATIERDNLLNSFVGMPTTKEVVKLGEYDDEIKQLTQELGLGQDEYAERCIADERAGC